MLTYCWKLKKDKESVDSKMLKTKNGRKTLSLKCAVCRTIRCVKEQEVKGLFRLKNTIK